MKLRNKVAVITGASRGIGKSIAEHYAAEGAKLVVSARDANSLGLLRDELNSKGTEAVSVVADVSKESDLVELVKAAIRAYGRIDILVNNAGFGIFKPVVEMKTEDKDKILKPADVAEAAVLAASLPATAMMSEIDLRPTNPK